MEAEGREKEGYVIVTVWENSEREQSLEKFARGQERVILRLRWKDMTMTKPGEKAFISN